MLMKRLELCGHFSVFVDFVLAFFLKGLPFSRLSKSHGYKTSVPEFFLS